jgi:3-methyladenine DNA glycosylase AlkD
MTDTADALKASIAGIADPEVAIVLQRYFKTGPGEYGDGDLFAGVRVPAIKALAKQFAAMPLSQIDMLLESEIHEHRAAALQILVLQFQRASGAMRRDDALQQQICDFYVAAVRRGRVNNWDLVDCSAAYILGELLLDRPRELLHEFAASRSLWERRVAIVSTFAFIKRGDASTTFDIAELLLADRHDLIHKAVGWALRDVGARIDRGLLCAFLDEHVAAMSSTTLSYATEHFDRPLREHYRGLRAARSRRSLGGDATSRASNSRVATGE